MAARHYLSTFGASAAVGLITGLSQFLGNVGFGGDGDRTIVIAGGVGIRRAKQPRR
jgi:hypothetical protein